MPNRSKASFPEIQEIREDLDSLKTNVVELTRHLRAEGEDQAHAIAEKARKKLALLTKNVTKTGMKEMEKVERRVKAHPAQSLAIAFAVGAVASLLAGRRAFR